MSDRKLVTPTGVDVPAEARALFDASDVIVRFWPLFAGLSIFACILSYIIEFSIYHLDIFYIMNMNDIAFKSAQNLIWFFSITFYVAAASYIVGLLAKLHAAISIPASVLVVVAFLIFFIVGLDLTHIWNRYVLYQLDAMGHNLGLDLINLTAREKYIAHRELIWSETHYVQNIPVNWFAWLTVTSVAVLSVVIIGVVARIHALVSEPLLVAAVVLPLVGLNATLGIDRAMRLDPEIARLEGSRSASVPELPRDLQGGCPSRAALFWQGEKSLVSYCEATRSTRIYFKDFGLVATQAAQ
jgi:hypothetical protein